MSADWIVNTSKWLLLLAVLLQLDTIWLASLSEEAPLDKIRVDERGNLVDSYGRVRIFRGINSIQKAFPWYSDDILDEERLRFYNDWGFNVVRLGCMWPGVYPNADHKPNQTYLEIIDRIINATSRYDMYTLLDMHQDVMAAKFKTYDGIPKWLVDQFPPIENPDLAYPWPFDEQKIDYNWGISYLTLEVGKDFQYFYHNNSGSWDHWAEFWRTVAGQYARRATVIGYELINEPWSGDIYANPARLLPGYAGKHNLLPVYDFLVKQIREVDRETLVFYEPVTWGYYFASEGLAGTGFDRVPGGAEFRNTSVLSYHYYCWLLLSDDPKQDYPEWKKTVCDNFLENKLFQSIVSDQEKLKMGIFLTEFGSCKPDNNSESINTIECDAVMREAEVLLQSWTYWDSNFFDSETSPLQPSWSTVQEFARTYPQATAGYPVKIQFDYKTGLFEFRFQLNSAIQAPTEIFVPLNVHYGGKSENVLVNIFSETEVELKYQISWSGNIMSVTFLSETGTDSFIDIRIEKRIE